MEMRACFFDWHVLCSLFNLYTNTQESKSVRFLRSCSCGRSRNHAASWVSLSRWDCQRCPHHTCTDARMRLVTKSGNQISGNAAFGWNHVFVKISDSSDSQQWAVIWCIGVLALCLNYFHVQRKPSWLVTWLFRLSRLSALTYQG